jgi:hypothetical protein
MSSGRAIEMIRAEFTRAIGPMAHPLLDQMLESLAMTPDEFPPGKLPELVEKLSWEIQSERRRVAFQKTALEQLQALGENEP